MPLLLDGLAKSIGALERSAKVAGALDTANADLEATVRAGVIQNFEVAYEQSWKMMKRWLARNIGRIYVDGVSRRGLFRLAAENRLITDVGRWMGYHAARNTTSHTYNEGTDQRVYAEASIFITDANRLLAALEERND